MRTNRTRKRDGGHGEEIDGDQIPDMVGEEGPPGLRGRGAPLRHEPGDRALGDVDAELQELSVDARRPPQAIRRGHLPDEGGDSAPMGGRPPGGRPESWVQCWRKRRRCHRRTVSGATITRGASRWSVWRGTTHQSRSVGRSLRPRRGPFVHRAAAGARPGSPRRADGGRHRGRARDGAGGERGRSWRLGIVSRSELKDQPLENRMELWRTTPSATTRGRTARRHQG